MKLLFCRSGPTEHHMQHVHVHVVGVKAHRSSSWSSSQLRSVLEHFACTKLRLLLILLPLMSHFGCSCRRKGANNCSFTVTRTWAAEDLNTNSIQAQFTYQVADTQPPVRIRYDTWSTSTREN